MRSVLMINEVGIINDLCRGYYLRLIPLVPLLVPPTLLLVPPPGGGYQHFPVIVRKKFLRLK